MPATSLRRTLERHHAAVRRALVTRHALRATAACVALIVLAVLAGTLGRGPLFAQVRLAGVVLGAIAAIGVAVRALGREQLRFDAWLEQEERALPDVRSWLRNALDLEAGASPHTSGELAGAVIAEASARLSRTDFAARRPAISPRVPLLAMAAAVGALALLVAFAPRQALLSWRSLWDPTRAAAPILLAVQPGSVTLAPGATLAIRAEVRGSADAPRLLGPGASPAPTLESAEGGMRRWRFDLPPVTHARNYAVRVRHVESPRYAISLTGEAQPVAFTIEYRSPAYTRLPAQTGSATRGDLVALRGSLARIEVTFDRDLESLEATLPGGRRMNWSAITPRRWRGEVPVDTDGDWSLLARAATGRSTSAWHISALTDAPPVLTVATPGGDIDLPSGSLVPYDVLVQDDFGLSEVRLQFRKEATQPWRDVPLSMLATQPREARIASRWDASALALLPGESGTFRFEARDNNRVSGPTLARSAEFRVRFPSMAELYENLDQRQENIGQSLQKVAEQARELQKSLDRMQRQQPRAASPPSQQFERAEEMRKALERQQELSRQLDQAAENMQSHMADAAEREAYRQQLQEKMSQVADLMRQIQSPEFREALERMQKAIERMDPRAMEQSLPQMQQMNRELMKNLERTLALLKQLRDEEKLDALSKRAEELKQKQDALNREYQQQAQKGARQQPQAASTAQRQEDAAKRTEELARDARESAEQMNGEQAKQDLQAAADQLEQQAAQQQKQASQQSQSGEPQKASQSGESASESLEQAAQRMNQSSQSAQQQREAMQLAAVRRAAQDLVSLGQEAAQNLQSPAAPQQQASRQNDLSEGIARVADSLSALGQETPVLSPQVSEALGRAMNQMTRSSRDLQQGNRAGGEQSGQAASSSLSEAVNALRSAEASMCKKPGTKPGQGSQGGGTPTMGELGKQQGNINSRSRELSQRMSQQMRLSAGDQAEVRRLADEQARLRQELESIQRDEAEHKQLLGRLDETHREMQEAEEMLRAGQLGDDLEERQTHILSRMLDAQRSLNRRDFDPMREARRGEDVARNSPAPLPASSRQADRLRLDLMKADADRYPAQYRALIERYLQRLNGSPR